MCLGKPEPMVIFQGKGHVVRRMFSDIEADVYVMVDGDATYDAASAPRLVSRLIETQADMVVGARITEDKAAYRAGHHFGNRMLTGLDDREKFIVQARYGFDDLGEKPTFQKLGQLLGVSKERVRQIEQRALAKLREMAQTLRLEPAN